MRPTGVACGLHAQFAGRIATQEITLHSSRFHYLAGLHAHAFVIKRRAAFAAQHKGVFKNVDVFGEHLLAQRVQQERTLAVQRPAADRLYKRT